MEKICLNCVHYEQMKEPVRTQVTVGNDTKNVFLTHGCDQILMVVEWQCDDDAHSLEYFCPPPTFGCSEFHEAVKQIGG